MSNATTIIVLLGSGAEGSSGIPDGTYTTEDGSAYYTTEDGSAYYIQE